MEGEEVGEKEQDESKRGVGSLRRMGSGTPAEGCVGPVADLAPGPLGPGQGL